MRSWTVVLLLIFTFTFGACGSKKTPEPESAPPLKTAIKQPDIEKSKPIIKDAEVEPEPEVKKPQFLSDLLVIGQKEYVFVDEAKMQLAARIDTGATTSSISATKIQRYERDGKKWVRFVLTSPRSGKTVQIERPLKRIASIKRHGMPDQERVVVDLHVRLGDIKTKTEFTLTDRSKFEFPVLIGRTFLSGRAVVDVTLEYETSPMSDENGK